MLSIYINSVAKIILKKELNLKIKNLKNYDGKKPFIVDSLQPKKNGIKLRFTKSSLLRFVKQNKELMVSKL